MVAVAVLALSLLPSMLPAPSVVVAAGCAGDEQILLAPAEPRVGSLMIVAAVSRTAHEQVLLLGPNGPIEVQRAPIGDRFVWQASLIPDRAGEHLFAFGVAGGAAPLVTCADARTLVAEGVLAEAPPLGDGAPALTDAPPVADAPAAGGSALAALLNPYGQSGASSYTYPTEPSQSTEPPAGEADAADAGSDAGTGDAPGPTRTPRPTRTPTPRIRTSSGNANDNGNENDSEADPTPTRVSTGTRTPTPTRTPRPDQLGAPEPTAAREPTATRTPRPDPTDTPQPEPTATRTPRPDPTDTREPTVTRTPRPDPTDTPVPTPTPTMEPPSIVDWVPASAVCGQSLTIRGERFGSSRSAVDGKVTIDGRESSIVSWGMSQIEVQVPLTAQPGNDRQLVVVVAGQSATRNALRVSC